MIIRGHDSPSVPEYFAVNYFLATISVCFTNPRGVVLVIGHQITETFARFCFTPLPSVNHT